MKIQFKKSELGATLNCFRDDGTNTWYRPKPQHASHFALHDLTHYAVESELADRDGFFSLVASGWAIEDFENSSTTDESLTMDARIIEWLVGQLDAERASFATWPAQLFNQHYQLYAKLRNLDSEFEIQQAQLERIREQRDELIRKWEAISQGEIMELAFPQNS